MYFGSTTQKKNTFTWCNKQMYSRVKTICPNLVVLPLQHAQMLKHSLLTLLHLLHPQVINACKYPSH